METIEDTFLNHTTKRFFEAGLTMNFVQDNESKSKKGS